MSQPVAIFHFHGGFQREEIFWVDLQQNMAIQSPTLLEFDFKLSQHFSCYELSAESLQTWLHHLNPKIRDHFLPHFQKLYLGDSAPFLKGRMESEMSFFSKRNTCLHIVGPQLCLVPFVPHWDCQEIWLPKRLFRHPEVRQRGTLGGATLQLHLLRRHRWSIRDDMFKVGKSWGSKGLRCKLFTDLPWNCCSG